jgi:hypothetical protein
MDRQTTQASDAADRTAAEWLLESRRLGLPLALVKALHDPFDYVVGTRDGRIIRFSKATMNEGDAWILFSAFEKWDGHGMQGFDFTFERGVYVRVSDIVWASDAPYGA